MEKNLLQKKGNNIFQYIEHIPQLHNYYKYLNVKNNPIIPETIHYARGDKAIIQAHITPFISPEQKTLSKNKINSTKLVKAASGVVYHRKYYHWQLQKQ
ncbi:hypothetical protein PROFUN_03707 [Planoprotostelium fungivorum]|uniref:Uncharacterized protein n=1 Tax=Planoprotostelium fungivorum TaxID=1890364 RepID=A0A2P6NDI0_9EUKA|nr:hypothetical protein PROFUN_03707 [Planoprotostelium fungivorum]